MVWRKRKSRLDNQAYFDESRFNQVWRLWILLAEEDRTWMKSAFRVGDSAEFQRLRPLMVSKLWERAGRHTFMQEAWVDEHMDAVLRTAVLHDDGFYGDTPWYEPSPRN